MQPRRKGVAARIVLAFAAGMSLHLSFAADPPNPQTAKQSDAPPLKLHVLGGLANVHQYTRHEKPFWTEVLPARTKGRVTADIVPFDQAGIRGTETLRLMEAGVLQFGTLLVGIAASTNPEFGAADLAALAPDVGSMRRAAAALRPYMAQLLRDRYGIELLAVYAYPAQMLFCKDRFTGLRDLAGRRIRTSTPSQSDLVDALGATAVKTGFAELMASMKSGNTDCAITGSMSGNTLGLHEVTTHIFSMPVSWGTSVFAASGATWRALPGDVRELLSVELPRLEAEIWAEADRETLEGVICNTGGKGCANGRKGTMVEVKPSAADVERLRQIFESVVLPRWFKRCGNECAKLWNQTLKPISASESKPR
ncbi:TRAP transporter substrate-binding protein [Aquabacterium sp. A7-Y]|uniref:TRAP transporter substrate-binding protein n=1 Tax=Aquabacterium sp. A7-Y TaxID=1349605 RepID=UPI00223CF59B|nr:TRAP transporter substrate-binding protein [Aquabacterium sp. A7-Y]MCW7536750.1 TRAP transporter substrate-binding protein [Aquabacterium sp. A7-Y]